MKKIAFVFAIISILGLTTQSFALEEKQLQDNATQPPRQMRVSERFGRSIANIFFSPLELPAQIYVRAKYQEDKADNPFAVAGGLVEGIPMGALVYFPWRLYAGLVDLFTIGSPQFDRAFIYPEYLSFSTDFLEKTKMPLDEKPQAGKN